jgi:hypothetical protein
VAAHPSGNPWHPWGIVQSYRHGRPVVTETQLWHLVAHHPAAVERASDGEMYLHLERPYRVVKLPDRAFMALEPVPDRRRASAQP